MVLTFENRNLKEVGNITCDLIYYSANNLKYFILPPGAVETVYALKIDAGNMVRFTATVRCPV